MRILFTGGGTAGHVLPNLAVIQQLGKSSEHAVLYVGEREGPEENICKKHGIPFRGIHAGKFRRYFAVQNIVDALKIPLGFFESLKIISLWKPDRVFAKGGYVSVPVGLASAIFQVPLFLHESDVSPGLATKILSPFAKKIFLSWEESKFYFRNQSKCEVVGIPLRQELFHGKKERGYEITGFSGQKPVVLIMGGSTGAKSVNELVWSLLPKLLNICQVIHITGPGKMTVELSGEKRHPQGNGFPVRYHAFEFVDEELPHLYAISDLVVSRAGASSIAEILALNKSNILIPLGKHASRGDQILNAEVCRKNGWSAVFSEEKNTPENFFALIKKTLVSKNKIKTAFSLDGTRQILRVMLGADGKPD